MSNDIKVGDTCIVIGEGWHFAPGEEVTVIRGPQLLLVANRDVSFLCRNADGMEAWCYRFKLQKKPPAAAPANAEQVAEPA